MQNQPIGLYLISGFLGAGKTTFLKGMIEGFSPQKLGVLVNEFGSVGVDGAQVRQSGLRLVEINNGSVFCACLKDGFVRTLKAFAQQPIDVLLIECSGMADPAGMNLILEGLAPYLARPYEYKGCVCLVDCTTFLDYVDVLMPVQSQVAGADLILVNKTDLVGKETVEEVHRYIRLLNEDAPVHSTIYAHIPPGLLARQLQNHGYKGETSNTPYNRPFTYILQAGSLCQKEQLEAFYAEISPLILRAKGFLPAQEGWWHLEGVAKNLEILPAELSAEDSELLGEGRLVVIAAGSQDIGGQLRAAWAAHCPGPLQLTAE